MTKGVLRSLGITTQRRFRLFLRSCALLIGLSAGLSVEILIQENCYYLALIPFAVVTLAAIVEFVFGDVLADQEFPSSTEKKFELIEKQLGTKAIDLIMQSIEGAIAEFRACDTKLVKATVHVLADLEPTAQHPARKGLLQLTDYVGPDGGGKGRVTMLTKGIIGRCARTERIETVDFASSDEYFKAMVRDFGFTAEEATLHTSTARSYLAVPLRTQTTDGPGALIGVMYFFTSEPQIFPAACKKELLEAKGREVVRLLTLAKLA